ncbi:hypothetical protein CO051_04705 [Candidatus Roizmanbacteria bacterium CG_4_9_14_0_2_um_filter_39_13]|uniref:Uncharacterized protein n=2 Tax=Candidatus Roizmaniibacteriota TaxID=1752723 RepID=A0A2M8EXT9_9BACT|nr:MAG: hypothetical protein COY15_05625 [Candidatus Roizmanbacteria bacterium CG_4_10_14_0_2_um_filter_39_12]PJC30957.1 MAG: hypothetical protein CO051_04705 [Candidatus Roizmanbacteria bacterium CG_4_9_14_0_2_um_filter_39_13]PJE61266.1 MAG: hypothetical protein COU87_05530 [Candidatus Roizmanbacteria bacterium CG10_big_fil_rev_8_21_14_0_10_39_12]
MPKKTKKQKLHAAQRRKSLVLRVPSIKKEVVTKSKDFSSTTPISTEGHKINQDATRSVLFGDIKESSVVFNRDLSKSLIISTILVAIQLGLFLSAKNNYFDISSVIRF